MVGSLGRFWYLGPPDWNKGEEHSEDRETTSYHGAAIGQTGTSTRQELTAWVRVLAIPCRNMYATDSASMLSKALMLIKAAERDQEEEAQGIVIKRGNPFENHGGCKSMETFGSKHG